MEEDSPGSLFEEIDLKRINLLESSQGQKSRLRVKFKRQGQKSRSTAKVKCHGQMSGSNVKSYGRSKSTFHEGQRHFINILGF